MLVYAYLASPSSLASLTSLALLAYLASMPLLALAPLPLLHLRSSVIGCLPYLPHLSVLFYPNDFLAFLSNLCCAS
jgi:hypothetical protein